MKYFEFTETSLKFWHIVDPTKKVVSLIEELPLDLQSQESVVAALEKVSAKHDVSSVEGLVLPRSSFVIRNMMLPEATKQEQRQMINLQLGNLLPYELDEIIFDFITYPFYQKPGQHRVLLFIILRKFLNDYLKYLAKVKVSPQFIFPSTSLVLSFYLKVISLTEEALNVFLEVDPNGAAELLVVLKGELILSRTLVYQQGNELEFIEQLSFSLQKAKSSFPHITMNHLITNHKILYLNIREKIVSTFTDLQVKLISLDLLRQFLHANTNWQDRNVYPTGGIGFLHLTENVKMDFVPPELKQRYRRKGLTHQLKKMGIFTGCFVLSILVFIGSDFFLVKKAYLKSMEDYLASRKGEIRNAKKILHLHNSQLSMREDKAMPYLIIADIIKMVPSNMFLTYLNFDHEDGLKVRGLAKSVSDVSDLLLLFQESPYLENADIKFAKKKVESNQEYTDFQIDCYLKGKTK